MLSGSLARPLGDLLTALEDTVSGAFSISGKGSQHITIDIKLNDLLREDASLLEQLFAYVSGHSKPSISIHLTKPLHQMKRINHKSLSNPSLSVEQLTDLFDANYILRNSILFVSLLSFLKKNNPDIQVSKWARRLQDEMLSVIKNKTRESLLEQHFKRNVIFLYQLSNDMNVLRNGIRYLLPLLIREKKLKALLSELDEKTLQDIVKSVEGEPYFYLHEAVKTGHAETIDIMLHLLKAAPALYDDEGNSLLHYCEKNQYFEKLLKFLPDINHRNRDGNTALHMAALHGNLDKARFLLMHGANPDIKNDKGETFYTISPNKRTDESLRTYRLYKQAGNVLPVPPKLIGQKGLTCGFYAVSIAASLHRDKHPAMFKSPWIPARKKDLDPKADISLRQLRKKLEIPGHGPIFSAAQLAKVINETECKSLICDIQDYSQFLAVIKRAIDMGLPVIIPFSLNEDGSDMPSTELKASTAHWATIIGYAGDQDIKGVLIAQYEQFYDTKADELFKSFFDIEKTFQPRLIAKTQGSEWDFLDKMGATDSHEVKIDLIPMTSLNDFRRKLIIVLPPEFDPSLWHQATPPAPKV